MFQPIIGNEVSPEFVAAGLVHDYIYRKECKLPISREEADVLFKYMLIEAGTDTEIAELMYWAVSIFGGSHFKVK